jgi:putative ABC transport system ATP-binding protein
MTSAPAEVVLERVSKTYEGRVRALVDVSMRVGAGEFVLLTGPSGCGKSTLLNLIGALDRPDSGSIRVAGESVAAIADPALYRRETVGFVFQLHYLLPQLSAQRNVEVPLIPAGVPTAERARRSRELLAEVGLADRALHLPGALSGGERQRVALARALVNRPRLLLADEPTGALDSVAARRVLALLGALRERFGMTVLLVSYDPAVGTLADRVVRMLDGRIVERGDDPPDSRIATIGAA